MGTADNSNSDLGAAQLLTCEESPVAGAEITAPSNDAVLHRLEFGKFCDSPNGPVEKAGGTAEHRVLGKSQDFPQLLSGYCNPSCIRVVNSEGESTPPSCTHATVLVPCFTEDDGLHQIFCRIRQRPEDAEGGVERKYNIARYLVPNNSHASPLLLFEAMETIPLHGLSRPQVAHLLPLRGVPREFVPNRVTQAFAKQALMYAISGIPIGFADAGSEREFFECVTALWWLLPPNLRPLLSAGWGVGWSALGRMTIAYADSRDSTVAVFSAAEKSWKPPAKVRVTGSNGTPKLVDYYPDRRCLGENFWQLVYGEDSEIDDCFVAFEASRGPHLDWVTELPEMKLEGVVDWNQHLTRPFRTPGLKAHDLRLLDRLHLWIRGETFDGNVAVNADQFTYQKTRTAAFEEILAAVGNPTERERAELALWETLAQASSPTLSTLLAKNERPGSFRARLLNAIRREDESKCLKYLFDAAGNGEANDLSAQANAGLQTLLDRSVKTERAEILNLHSNLLTLDEMPESYRDWVLINRLELLSLSAHALGGVDEELSQRLFEFSKDNAISALVNLDKNLAPSMRDKVTIERLSASDREKFVWFLTQRWLQVDGDVAARRENLLPWLGVLRPINSGRALWCLALNEPVTLDAAQCAEIAEEVRHHRVPDSLRERVAITVLELWPRFSASIRSDPSAWDNISALFPLELEKLLLCRLNLASRKVSRAIKEAAQKCHPDPDEVNKLIEFWNKFERFANFGPLLWQWATSERATTGTSGLISQISRFHSPGPEMDPTWDDLDEVVRLATAAGQEAFFIENQEKLWKPSVTGWQAFLLLRLMPQADIAPTLEQLNSLIPCRERLRRYLDEQFNSIRKQRFRVASLDFHELEYEKDQNLWRDEYATCNLWAIFRRVPVRKQQPGSLRSALRSFSKKSPDPDVIAARARMCIDYLNSYSTSDDYEAALRKVFREGLIPLLAKGGRRQGEIWELVKNTQKDISPSWGGSGFFRSLFPKIRNHRRVYIQPESLEELLFLIVSSYTSDSSLSADFSSSFRH